MPYMEVEPGVKLYYEDFGEGRPFLFVHGGAQSHDMWEQQVYELADHYRTITYDLRGCGESDKPAAGNTLDGFVADLGAIVAKLKLDNITLVCHGIAGYIGVTFAVSHPDLVSRLVMVGTAARFSGADEERGGFSIDLWNNYKKAMALNKANACAWLIDNTFFHKDPGPATKQVILETMVKWPLYAWKLINRSLEKVDLAPILGDIKASTLILHGEHDRKQRYSGVEHLAKYIPGSRIVTFSESAHMPHLEEPEKFNRVLIDFVEGRLNA
jgi:pimeloyl-ACP methyl ester carboxylesterase